MDDQPANDAHRCWWAKLRVQQLVCSLSTDSVQGKIDLSTAGECSWTAIKFSILSLTGVQLCGDRPLASLVSAEVELFVRYSFLGWWTMLVVQASSRMNNISYEPTLLTILLVKWDWVHKLELGILNILVLHLWQHLILMGWGEYFVHYDKIWQTVPWLGLVPAPAWYPLVDGMIYSPCVSAIPAE